jgi:hypothetical protein
MTGRREFLKFLGLATLAVTATGLPGTEVIKVIAEAEKIVLTDAEIIALELERVRRHVPLLFRQDNVFFEYIKTGKVEVVAECNMRIPLQLGPKQK